MVVSDPTELCASAQTLTQAFGIRACGAEDAPTIGHSVGLATNLGNAMKMKTGKKLSDRTNSKPTESVKNDLDIKSREDSIAVIAYFKAQARGFGENAELDDWLAAEREFEAAKVAAGKAPSRDV